MTEKSWLWPIRITTALLSLTLVLAGAATVTGSFFLRRSTQTTSFTDPVRRVEVSTDTGDVVIRAGAAGTPSRVSTQSATAFRTTVHSAKVTAGVLKVAGSCPGGTVITGACSVDFSIVVPPGTAVGVTTRSGDVTIVDAGDSVAVSTTSGDVAVHFTQAPRVVRVETGSGDVRIGVPDDKTSYVVQGTTSSGDRYVTVPTGQPGAPPTDVRVINVTSGSGDVVITPDG